jgi:hypothetical protein
MNAEMKRFNGIALGPWKQYAPDIRDDGVAIQGTLGGWR